MKPFLISIVTDVIDAPVALVYNIVTDNKNFQWRKEVENIELLEDGFIEYYKGGDTRFLRIFRRKEMSIMPLQCNTNYSIENGKESLNRITEVLKFAFKRKFISKTSF